MPLRPAFFSFEGIDGSGKSTQIKLLETLLKAKGFNPLCLREPGGTPLSDKIRELLLSTKSGSMQPQTELLLYSAARAQLVADIIAPALTAGKIILADRFGWSTLAYQGYGREMDKAQIKYFLQVACGNIWPEHTFLLDIDPAAMRQRIQIDGRVLDRMEKESEIFFQKVRQGYLSIAQENPQNFTVLNGSLPIEELQQKIAEEVLQKLAVNSL